MVDDTTHLRELAEMHREQHPHTSRKLGEAADEIERLRKLVQSDGAEMDRLRAVARDREQRITELTESR